MISIDASLIIVFFIVWILVIILTKVFFNPIRKIMSERKTKIEASLRATARNSENSEQIFNQIEETLSKARAKSQTIRAKFEQEGWNERQRLLNEVNRTCRKEVETVKIKLERQIKEIKKELEIKSKDFALQIERKLLN